MVPDSLRQWIEFVLTIVVVVLALGRWAGGIVQRRDVEALDARLRDLVTRDDLATQRALIEGVIAAALQSARADCEKASRLAKHDAVAVVSPQILGLSEDKVAKDVLDVHIADIHRRLDQLERRRDSDT